MEPHSILRRHKALGGVIGYYIIRMVPMSAQIETGTIYLFSLATGLWVVGCSTTHVKRQRLENDLALPPRVRLEGDLCTI